jgi:hypothetical protein
VATALLLGALSGTLFVLYAMGAGAARGILMWLTFVATASAVAVGGPALLVYAWPGVIAVCLGAAVWLAAALGAGALWLSAATVAVFMAIYFAATEFAPLGAAAFLAWLAWEGGAFWGVAAFLSGAVALFGLRRKITASLLMGGWVLASGSAASYVVRSVLGTGFPDEWRGGAFPGPTGIGPIVLLAAVGAAVIVWPRTGRAATGAAESGPAS